MHIELTLMRREPFPGPLAEVQVLLSLNLLVPGRPICALITDSLIPHPLYAAQKEEFAAASSKASHLGAVMAKTHTVIAVVRWPGNRKPILRKRFRGGAEKLISSHGVGVNSTGWSPPEGRMAARAFWAES